MAWNGKQAGSHELKSACVLRYLETGEIRKTAAAFGVEPSTLQSWIRAHKAGGDTRAGLPSKPEDIALRAGAGSAKDDDEISRLLVMATKVYLKRLIKEGNKPDSTCKIQAHNYSQIIDKLIVALHSRVDVRKGEGAIAPLTATKTLTREEKIRMIVDAVQPGGGTKPQLAERTRTETETVTVTDNTS